MLDRKRKDHVTRIGEALAVTWDNFRWDEKAVSINQSYRRQLSSTKIGSEREVDLADVLVDALNTLHIEKKKEALRTGSPVPDIVFHRKGSNMSQDTTMPKHFNIMAFLSFGAEAWIGHVTPVRVFTPP